MNNKTTQPHHHHVSGDYHGIDFSDSTPLPEGREWNGPNEFADNPIAWRWRDNEHQSWNFTDADPARMDYVFVEPLYARPGVFELCEDEGCERHGTPHVCVNHA